MKTKAVRLYGKNDLRLEEFELPEIKEDEILAKVVSDGICMSTYKAVLQGEDHKRVPNSIAEKPIIIGHEFCAEIIRTGLKWQYEFSVGEKIIMPPVINCRGKEKTVGYAFEHIGGASEHIIIPSYVIESGNLLKTDIPAFFIGSLVEPISCIINGLNSTYHTDNTGEHIRGIRPGGKIALLAGCGSMGLGAIDCIISRDIKPSLLVVTDKDTPKLAFAEKLFAKKAEENGVTLNFTDSCNPEQLTRLTSGSGFDDVFVFAPVPLLAEVGGAILSHDGCLNFFAGPTRRDFSAKVNFYDVHYSATHIVGTSGSSIRDFKETIMLLDKIDPSVMVTHVGGLDSVINTTINLPSIPGGKKLIYTGISMPSTPINELRSLGTIDAGFKKLACIVENNNGFWCSEAETYLLEFMSGKK